MTDGKVAEIQAEIDRLEAKKQKRIKELANPNHEEIRKLWDQLNSIIKRLDVLGENVSDYDGDAPYLRGVMFRMDYNGEIVES